MVSTYAMNAAGKSMLELKDIHKSFGSVKVLKGVSVNINKGELISFVGPSGCGKTTLLRIVGGFTRADSGRVLLEGVDIANLRLTMREEVTTIFVTHDQYEAMSISERIIVLFDGVIQQIGTPIEIYNEPTNRFIAGFVGYVNLLEGKVESVNDENNMMIISTVLGKLNISRKNNSIKPGTGVLLVIRPDTVHISPPEAEKGGNMFYGEVENAMYAGSLAKYRVKVADHKIIIDQQNPKDAGFFTEKEKVSFVIPESTHVLLKE